MTGERYYEAFEYTCVPQSFAFFIGIAGWIMKGESDMLGFVEVYAAV